MINYNPLPMREAAAYTLRTPEGEQGAAAHLPSSITETILLLKDLPTGILLATRNGTILWMNARLRQQLRSYFGPCILPLALDDLFNIDPDDQHVGSLLDERESQQWTARLASDTAEGRLVRIRHLPKPTSRATAFHCFLSIEFLPAPAKTDAIEQQHYFAYLGHEIRNCAHVIGGMIDSIEESSLAGMGISHLRTARDLLADLTDQLQTQRTGEQFPGITQQEEAFDLTKFVQAVCQIPMVGLRNKPVGFEFVPDPSLPHWVRGNRVAIYQILINLLSNAIKYTQSGKITLEAIHRPSAANRTTEIEFRITDTGIGIADDRLSEIFTPFHREPQGLQMTEGSGIGLSISRQLAKKIGGNISVESKLGQGSIFSLRIPLAVANPTRRRPDYTSPTPVAERTAIISPPRVLVLEDNPLCGSFLSYLLNRRGCVSRICTNGHEAMQALSEEAYDLILLDQQTPGQSGIEIATRLRQTPSEHHNARTPVILMTASLPARALSPDQRELVNEVIRKPFQKEEIDRILRAYGPVKAVSPASAEEAFIFSAPFDTELLQRTFQGHYDNLAQLFAGFVRTTKESILVMEVALRAEQWQEVDQELHKLKPSFSLIGLTEIAQTTSSIHQLLERSRAEQVLCSKTLKAYFSKVRSAIDLVEHECERLKIFLHQ